MLNNIDFEISMMRNKDIIKNSQLLKVKGEKLMMSNFANPFSCTGKG